MTNLNYSVRALNKPSAIMLKAAEHIQRHMERYGTGEYGGRSGVCAALDMIEYRLENAIRTTRNCGYTYWHDLTEAQRGKLVKMEETVERARNLFKEFYGYTNGKNPRERSGYWFGKDFTDKQQQHRIEALLTAAHLAEEMGE